LWHEHVIASPYEGEESEVDSTLLAAHSFVLVGECGSCNLEEVRVDSLNEEQGTFSTPSTIASDDSFRYFSLDCRDFPIDIVLAALSFLYTQEFHAVHLPLVRPPLTGKDDDEQLEQFLYKSEELWNAIQTVSTDSAEAAKAVDFGQDQDLEGVEEPTSSSSSSTSKPVLSLKKKRQLAAKRVQKAAKTIELFKNSLSWPRNRRLKWLMDLYRFAHYLTAINLCLYVEDSLIGCLDNDLWVDLLIFATDFNTPRLQDAAMQYGIRQLSPFVFKKYFGVKQRKQIEDSSQAGGGGLRQRRGGKAQLSQNTAADQSLSPSKKNADVLDTDTFRAPLSPKKAAVGSVAASLEADYKKTDGDTSIGDGDSDNSNTTGASKTASVASRRNRGPGWVESDEVNWMSFQSQTFKSGPFEAFLFDVDLPVAGLIMKESFGSNVLKELKKRSLPQFSALKDRLIEQLVEYEKVGYNLDLILNKSVFHTDDNELEQIVQTAKKGFASFFYRSTGKVPVNVDALKAQYRYDPSLAGKLRRMVPREKFLLGYLIIRYFWEGFLFAFLFTIWYFRNQLEERIFPLYVINQGWKLVYINLIQPIVSTQAAREGDENSDLIASWQIVTYLFRAFNEQVVMILPEPVDAWYEYSIEFAWAVREMGRELLHFLFGGLANTIGWWWLGVPLNVGIIMVIFYIYFKYIGDK